MVKKFETKVEEGLPRSITSDMVSRWSQQVQLAEKSLSGKILKIQLPYFMKNDEIDSARLLTEIQKRPLLRDAGISTGNTLDVPTVYCDAANLHETLAFLRDEPEFDYSFLLDLTSVDLLNSPEANDIAQNENKRFQMHYQLRSLKHKGMRIRVIVPIDLEETVPSIVSLWAGANWPEREVYDLMGLSFTGHPDMRRILMPDEYKGHPLRKDFPIQGIGEDYLITDLLTEHEENM